MFPRILALAFVAAVVPGLFLGCALEAPAPAALMTQSVTQHPDPNAPYAVPAPTRNMTPAPSRLADAEAVACTPANLSVQEIAGNVHGTWHSAKLAFRNTGKVPCRLSGYPIVALLDSEGKSVGSIAIERASSSQVMQEMAETAPAGTAASAPAAVVLVPKAFAAFEVVWTAGDACPSVARFLLTAPGTSHAFSIAQPIHICDGRLQVTSLRLDQADD